MWKLFFNLLLVLWFRNIFFWTCLSYAKLLYISEIKWSWTFLCRETVSVKSNVYKLYLLIFIFSTLRAFFPVIWQFPFFIEQPNCSPYCSYSNILLLFWCNNVSVSHYIVVNKRGSQLFQFSSHKDSIEEVEVLGIDKVQRGLNFQTLHQYSGVP